jgi:hypothetical protein
MIQRHDDHDQSAKKVKSIDSVFDGVGDGPGIKNENK